LIVASGPASGELLVWIRLRACSSLTVVASLRPPSVRSGSPYGGAQPSSSIAIVCCS
jgi:hypothetical protein